MRTEALARAALAIVAASGVQAQDAATAANQASTHRVGPRVWNADSDTRDGDTAPLARQGAWPAGAQIDKDTPLTLLAGAHASPRPGAWWQLHETPLKENGAQPATVPHSRGHASVYAWQAVPSFGAGRPGADHWLRRNRYQRSLVSAQDD